MNTIRRSYFNSIPDKSTPLKTIRIEMLVFPEYNYLNLLYIFTEYSDKTSVTERRLFRRMSPWECSQLGLEFSDTDQLERYFLKDWYQKDWVQGFHLRNKIGKVPPIRYDYSTETSKQRYSETVQKTLENGSSLRELQISVVVREDDYQSLQYLIQGDAVDFQEILQFSVEKGISEAIQDWSSDFEG